MPARDFEWIPHTADLAMRAYGHDLAEVFVNAAVGLLSVMAEPPATEDREQRIDVDSPDRDALLVDWLNELIFRHETDGETYARFVIDTLTDTHLAARAFGGATTRKLKTVKAATYHDLSVVDTGDGVEARIVFDV